MEEDQMDMEELQRLRETWLLMHDQRTNGVMGMLPLAYDMPLRFTTSVCAEKKVYRNTPGKLKGIILAAEEEASLREHASSEVVFVKMPRFTMMARRLLRTIFQPSMLSGPVIPKGTQR